MGRQGLQILSDGFTLDGKPFYLISGEMHYFRNFKDSWGRRLDLMKDFGLNTVQVYVPWNAHEPEKGVFDFSGNLDLGAFLQECQDRGLYVILRPSPYICAEWEFGGLPYWLKKDRTMVIRTSDAKFLSHVNDYYKRLSQVFLPYLYTNGGPIISICIENEYGSFGDDNDYLVALAKMLTDCGADVPYFGCGGWEYFKLTENAPKDCWTTLDLHALTDNAITNIKKYQPNKPIFISEFWAGGAVKWGVSAEVRPTELVADLFKDILYKGGYVNFYMFIGGTNFGFTNGANELRQSTSFDDETVIYAPFVTSYDTFAPVNEYGTPTPKYYALKKVLKDFCLDKGIPFTGNDDFTFKKDDLQKLTDVKMQASADFLSNVDNLTVATTKTGKPAFMEDLNQDTGFILYTSYIKYVDDQPRMLKIKGVRDRATVYIDGEYKGVFERDKPSKPLTFKVGKDGARIDILVENLGTINYGVGMLDDLKGINGYVRVELIEQDNTLYPWNYTMKTNWVNRSIPLKDISKIDYSIPAKLNRPAFYKASFKAQKGKDALIDTKGLGKGNIFINGFNIGRYWEIGPQRTLYVPGELLKEDNEIVVFEIQNTNLDVSIKFTDKTYLTEPVVDVLKNSKVED